MSATRLWGIYAGRRVAPRGRSPARNTRGRARSPGVLHEAPEEEGPRQVVHRVLLAADGAGDDLRVEVLVEGVRQGGLDREWFV